MYKHFLNQSYNQPELKVSAVNTCGKVGVYKSGGTSSVRRKEQGYAISLL